MQSKARDSSASNIAKKSTANLPYALFY